MKLILGMTCIEQVHHATVFSLLNTFAQKPELFDGFLIIQGTLLPHARNKIVDYIYKAEPDFTHILLVDADMCNFTPEHIQKLIDADKDVISGLFNERKPPYGTISAFTDEDADNFKDNFKNGKVVPTEIVGAAFTLIKREVFDKMREETSEGPIWFTCDRFPRESIGEEIKNFIAETVSLCETQPEQALLDAIFFGQTAHIGSRFLGEDINFSRKAVALGFKLFIHLGCVIGHVGEINCDIYKKNDYNRNKLITEGKLKLVTGEN